MNDSNGNLIEKTQEYLQHQIGGFVTPRQVGERIISHVDQETGEVTGRELVVSNQEDDVVLLKETEIPEYIIQISTINRDRNDLLAILSIFENGTLVRFTRYVGQDVNILGAIIWHHPPYLSKKEKDDKGEPLLKVGYDQIRFLTDKRDENDNPIVVFASYGSLANHVRAILSVRGWYLWDEPVKYRFKINEDSGAFQIIDMDRVNRLLPKKTGNK